MGSALEINGRPPRTTACTVYTALDRHAESVESRTRARKKNKERVRLSTRTIFLGLKGQRIIRKGLSRVEEQLVSIDRRYIDVT